MRATRLDVALLDLRSGAGRAEECRSLRVCRIIRQLDCPDRLALRILIGARVYELARLAARTTQVFQRARECTELTPAQIETEMLRVLDRESGDGPPG
jgi:hypothetical protein